ncbi:hypothetical protein F2Q69_00028781 [Brassica cretica]|uniref:Uncharacterized protein n=1 Tax=Brassica cretica TaxID=69181 RepID=A0A8S9RX26_BRACR|nr:hypothetical protein F2Q69_00028781 [Brassica cretica]
MNLNSGKHGLSLLRSSGDSIRSDRALTRARSLRSDRALARTWLLRSDRTACMRGNYATVELGNHPFRDGWNGRYVFVKIQEPVGYPTSWRTVDVSRLVSFAGEAVAKLIMGIPRRFRWATFLVSREALRHTRVWGLRHRLSLTSIQKVKARKRRLSYIPPPRLARAALSAGGLSSISSTSAEIMTNRGLLADAHRRLTSEALLLHGQVQDMMACQDLLIQQVRASARWELMKEWQEKCVDHWNPEEEYRRHLFLSRGFNHRS